MLWTKKCQNFLKRIRTRSGLQEMLSRPYMQVFTILTWKGSSAITIQNRRMGTLQLNSQSGGQQIELRSQLGRLPGGPQRCQRGEVNCLPGIPRTRLRKGNRLETLRRNLYFSMTSNLCPVYVDLKGCDIKNDSKGLRTGCETQRVVLQLCAMNFLMQRHGKFEVLDNPFTFCHLAKGYGIAFPLEAAPC